MLSFLQAMWHGAHTLAKSAKFSIVVVLILAIGIGANTAIFSLVEQILLSTLPVLKPEQLVLLTAPAEIKGGSNSTGEAGGMEHIFSYPMFRELEKRPEGLTGLAAFRDINANLAYGTQSISGGVLMVSGGYFPILGVKPFLGRLIASADDINGGGNPVAVLSYSFWRDWLGMSQEALNRPLRINGQVFTIVGVAPKGFTSTTMGLEANAYVPLSLKASLTPNWDGTRRWDDFWLYLFGRLKPGTTMAQAQTQLNGVFRGLTKMQVESVSHYDRRTAELVRKSSLTLKDGSQGNSEFRNDMRVPLFILMTATALVLLIAVANVANLLQTRAAKRRRELAIRTALGANRGEILKQLLAEGLLLAGAGGVAGLLVATITLRVLLHMITAGNDVPQDFLTARLQYPVLLFSFGISLLAGLLSAIYPAWEAARTSMAATLKEETNQASGAKSAVFARKLLVCAQVTMAAALLIPTGLFLKSMVNLMRTNLGINTENLVKFTLAPERNGYKPEQSRALFKRLETEMAMIPGVRGVSSSLLSVIGGDRWGSSLEVEGYAVSGPYSGPHAFMNNIGTGFFGNMGIPLIAGREFTESDDLAQPEVALINQEFARKYFPGRNPIGRHLGYGRSKINIEVVGIVKDSHYASVKEKPYPVYYTAWRQDKTIGVLTFYVRTALPPAQIIPQIRKLVARLDSTLPLKHLRTLDEQIAVSISNDRIVVQLAVAFSILATVLAMLGLYGVIAQGVTRRIREIGIRMAIGATPGRIRGMVIREMLWITGIGLGLGIPAALALARYAKSQLYEVEAYAARIVLCAMLVLGLTAIAAAYFPARRAALVNPVWALRHE